MMTPLIHFTKMHGLGNSYIYLDSWKNQLSEAQLVHLAIALSNPYTGIGSDGLILISPSANADLLMRIFNKDGSEGKNCGNGLRCVAKYALEHQLVKNKKMTIETLGGIFEATVEKHDLKVAEVSVNMGTPQLLREKIPMVGPGNSSVVDEHFYIYGRDFYLTAVSMGNPHAVIFINKQDTDLHLTIGPLIEKDGRFPEGVNVEFVYPIDAYRLRCYVWERGSGATQACGTGACASVVAAVLKGITHKDADIKVILDGGELAIRWNSDGNIIMRGAAETIAEGQFMC